MSYKSHTQFKQASKRALSGRKHSNKCEECSKICCAEHLYKYTDDTNASINYSSPYLCKKCYEKKHNTKIKTEKNLLIDQILRDYKFLKSNEIYIDFNNGDKFYKFIQKYLKE